jgi:hypothetical protein
LDVIRASTLPIEDGYYKIPPIVGAFILVIDVDYFQLRWSKKCYDIGSCMRNLDLEYRTEHDTIAIVFGGKLSDYVRSNYQKFGR